MTRALNTGDRPWIVFIDGWRPALVNELMGHHFRSARRRRSDFVRIGLECLKSGVPTALGPRRVRLTITQPGGRRPDPDGVWKSLLDGLVRCGRLVDDSEKFCRCEPVVFRTGPRSTMIELEDL